MKRSIIRKAGTVFLSTATGLCFWSAEAGFAQDGPWLSAAPDSSAFPLEPPRPAIRQPAQPGDSSPRTVHSNPAQAVELPSPPAAARPGLIAPGGRQAPGLISDRNAAAMPQIVPRFAPPDRTNAGPAIVPGPSSNPSDSSSEMVPEPEPLAQDVPRAGYLPPSSESEEDRFEMPILSVPTLTNSSSPGSNAEPKPFDNQSATAAPVAIGAPVWQTQPGVSGMSHLEVGLDGFCPVMLRDGRTQVQGSEQHTSIWQGILYRLASAQAKRRFDAQPELYAPALGGIDVIKASTEGKKVQGSLEHAVWYRRQLYLFQDGETRSAFAAHPEKYAGK